MSGRADRTGPGRSTDPAAGRGQDRYGLLLLLLVGTYLLSAFATTAWLLSVTVGLYVVAFLLALRSSRFREQARPGGVAVLVGGSLAAVLAVAVAPNPTVKGAVSLWAGLVLLRTVVAIVRRVLTRRVVSIQTIYGAVSAYLVIGLMFAQFYAGIDRLSTGPFFVSGQAANTNTLQYFSFVTLTTVGYGDYTSAETIGRAVAVLEALLGQIFLATLVSHLVASFRPGHREYVGADGDDSAGQDDA